MKVMKLFPIEASWTFVLDMVKNDMAKVEKISTKIIDMISTAPRRVNSIALIAGAIFSPPRKHPMLKRLFNNFSIT